MNADKALELARLAYPNDENLRVAYMLGLNAGAEWMAEQGYHYEDKVYLLEGGDTHESYPGLDGEGERQCIDKAIKVGYLGVGDKVIVQIRKK